MKKKSVRGNRKREGSIGGMATEMGASILGGRVLRGAVRKQKGGGGVGSPTRRSPGRRGTRRRELSF